MGFFLARFGELDQPLFQRQADRQQIARQRRADAGEAAARIPGPGQHQQRGGDGERGVGQRLDVADAADQRVGQRAENEDGQREKDQQAVEEVEGVARPALRRVGRKEQKCGQQERHIEARWHGAAGGRARRVGEISGTTPKMVRQTR